MRLLTWNIQCGKGCDGVIDLARIVAVARQIADADVFCFQEVSRRISRDSDGGADQSAQLAALLPGYIGRYFGRRSKPSIGDGNCIASAT